MSDSKLWQTKMIDLTAEEYRNVLVNAGLRLLAKVVAISIAIGLVVVLIVAAISSNNAKKSAPNSSCDYASILTCAEQGF